MYNPGYNGDGMREDYENVNVQVSDSHLVTSISRCAKSSGSSFITIMHLKKSLDKEKTDQ